MFKFSATEIISMADIKFIIRSSKNIYEIVLRLGHKIPRLEHSTPYLTNIFFVLVGDHERSVSFRKQEVEWLPVLDMFRTQDYYNAIMDIYKGLEILVRELGMAPRPNNAFI